MHPPSSSTLRASLLPTVEQLLGERHLIAPERAALLARLADYLTPKVAQGTTTPLYFICTHNSRRSHIAQLWAAAAAAFYGFEGIQTESAGQREIGVPSAP